LIAITNRKVSAISEKQLSLTWAVAGDPDDGEQIAISRSEFAEGPFAAVTTLAVSATSYLDSPNEFYMHRKYYYVIKSTVDTSDVAAVAIARLPDNLALEVSRLQQRHLERDVGELCAVFHKTTLGVRCSECWDEDLDQVTKDNCTTCLGTRFETAFGDQIDAYIQLPLEEITPTRSNTDMPGEQDVRMISMSNYPIIDRGDIIIEKETKDIWMVAERAQVLRTTKRGFIINQSAQVDHISPSSILIDLLAVMV